LWTASGENQPNDALSLEALTLGLARMALIAGSRSPVLATIHGAAKINTTSKIARRPSRRGHRDFGLLTGLSVAMALPAFGAMDLSYRR
jgi:hypothetical protein